MDSEIFKIVLTSALTIFGGVIVLVGGQIAIRFFIDPVHNQSKILGQIINSLILYANLNYNREKDESVDDDLMKKIEAASGILRQQASQLRAATYSIKWYRLFRLLGLVPKKSNADSISSALIGWSNHLLGGQPSSCISAREKIGRQLGVDAHR